MAKPYAQVREELRGAAMAAAAQLETVASTLTRDGDVNKSGLAFIDLGPRMKDLGLAMIRWNDVLDQALGPIPDEESPE